MKNYSNQLKDHQMINPKRAGTELSQFTYVNVMAADAPAPYVARTSAAMILTI